MTITADLSEKRMREIAKAILTALDEEQKLYFSRDRMIVNSRAMRERARERASERSAVKREGEREQRDKLAAYHIRIY